MSPAEIYSLILTTLIGVVGFFVKRAFSDISLKADHSELERIEKLLNDKADRSALTALEREAENSRNSISEIKDNYLTREDFFREQVKTEKKLDKIMDILMEMKGGAVNE